MGSTNKWKSIRAALFCPGEENSLAKGTTRLSSLLSAKGITSLSEWGGLEHDIYEEGERVFPISRHGVLSRSSR